MRCGIALAMVGTIGCVPSFTSQGPLTVTDWVAPDNGWGVTGTPPAGAACQGFDVGERPCDLRLQDQHGDEVSLWQFWGDVVVVDVSTVWCRPCQELAATTQATYEHFEPQGFMYLTILQEDVEGNPPVPDDLDLWADAFGIEAPVLDDGAKVAGGAVRQGQYPAVLVLDRELKVRERVEPPTSALLDAAIADVIGG